MNKIIAFCALLMIVACSQPDPFDEVRALRRNVKMKLDLAVDSGGQALIELEAQNLTGGMDLQDLTVIIRLLDGDQNVLWSKQKVLELTGVGNYGFKTFEYKEMVPEEAVAYEFFDVILAPDDENSDFRRYKEFMRAAN